MRPGDLAALVMMQYKVTAQFARGEERIIAELAEVNDARLFIAKKVKNRLWKNKILFIGSMKTRIYWRSSIKNISLLLMPNMQKEMAILI